MWLVRIALSRPYTFIVLALVLLMSGILSILRTPTDVFPSIDIPVVSVVWTYQGLPPDDMANRITGIFERAVSTTVNNIEHIESESLIGISVTKLFFQPGVDIAVALSEVTAISQTLLKLLPPGTTPPQIISYDASTVPILQLVLSSSSLPEQSLNDLGNNFIRTQLAMVQGAALPSAYGGKMRQINVDLDAQALLAYGISAQTVNAALNAQSLIIPGGTEKIGQYEYFVTVNSSPLTMDEFNHLPVTSSSNQVVYMKDVAHVRDGFTPQTNVVRINGERAVMMSVEKTGNASTLDIIHKVKALLPMMKANMPKALQIALLNDQSIFVLGAIKGVIFEAIIAATLTSLMILLFLGSIRSTFIITVSIPLSMLASLSLLAILGQTINIMTLGGLALAVGILVDDATVAIENINWNLEQGKPVKQAILDGAQQISIPAFVSTLCICIVFVPMFYLSGIAKYLFIPFAEAVIFAMLTSYFLSRTLVPTLAHYWLHEHSKTTRIGLHQRFEDTFDRFREHYHVYLSWVLNNTTTFFIGFIGFMLGSIILLWPWLGSNFFPTVDAGNIKLHFSAPTGTRVEETTRLSGQIEQLIRRIIPANELNSVIANIGLPVSGINLTYSNSATNGPQDADLLISLRPQHRPIETYIYQIREKLKTAFPGIDIAFLPADIVNQILNFGLPSVIDIQVMGFKLKQNRAYANALLNRLRHVPGIVDARIRQADNYPSLSINVDRSRAKELGFTQMDVASNVLLSLAGSLQVAPNFWVDPHNGVSYPIITQVPQYNMNSLPALRNTPIANPALSSKTQVLGAMSTIQRTGLPVVVSHYNVQPVIDIYAGIQDRDLGSVTHDINNILYATKNDVPAGSQVLVHGQIETQQYAFTELYWGLLLSIVLIYFIIVVNFQSWIDPFIIISALPAALAGIAWMLFITHTTLSVPALTGAIMCMGVATANSILVVSFARHHLSEGHDSISSALSAGVTRLRPVLMTALAMILGMIPMALGLGDGGEQNAPLGRAVIGGLLFATVATLFFVPAIFSVIHNRRHEKGHTNA